MADKGLTNRTIDGFLWVLSGTGFKTISQLLFLVVMARLLTPQEFGLVASVGLIIAFADMFMKAGIVPSLINLPRIHDNHLYTAFTVSLLLGTSIYTAVYFLTPWIGMLLDAGEGFTEAARTVSIVFIVMSFSKVSDALLQRELKFKQTTYIQAVSYVVGFMLVGITLGFLGFGFWSIIIAEITKSALKSVLTIIVRPHKVKLKIHYNSFKDIFYFGSGFTLGKFIDYFADNGDKMIIARLLGESALGYYTRAYQLMSVPVTIINQIFEKVLFPVMSRLQGKPQKLSDAFIKSLSFIFLISLPGSLLIYLTAPELIRAVLGPGWENTIVILQILAVGMVFRSGYKVCESLANAKGAVYQKAARQGVFAVLVFVLGGSGAVFGLPGIATGILLAFVINFLMMMRLSMKLIPIKKAEVLGSLRPALYLTAAAAVPLYYLVYFMRDINMHYMWILLLTASAFLTITAVFIKLNADFFIGWNGQWALEKITRKFKVYRFYEWMVK
ncbi:lipopolysaccharide biosynthesis protein [Alkalicoccus saliphilus]|uniref:Lipopolysaccharide biosynthesis protein n=1 Tax=Alkalicoccus saliphilus TaxID=200989 RepID=A0A2T4U2Z2_9BACI|nr:lipopolysaccharide biosynthesis protein [Alkalicoccus saliphilus]PTL37771.1 hypothetical protein C6Y45_14780 [Alkalicoccus saliphilus]